MMHPRGAPDAVAFARTSAHTSASLLPSMLKVNSWQPRVPAGPRAAGAAVLGEDGAEEGRESEESSDSEEKER